MKTVSSNYIRKTRKGRVTHVNKTVTKYTKQEKKANRRDFLLKATQHPEYNKTQRAKIYAASAVASVERGTANIGNSISQTGVFGKSTVNLERLLNSKSEPKSNEETE